MKRLGRCATLIATAAVIALCQPAQPEQELTLESAIAAALQNNRDVRIAELEVRKAAERTASYASRKLPNLSVNLIGGQLLTRIAFQFPAGAFGVYPSTGPIPSQSSEIVTSRKPVAFANATVMQPITQLHKVNLSVRMGQLGEELARMRVQSQRQIVVNDVRKLYYAMVQTQSGLETLRDSLDFVREMDRVVAQYVSERVALRSDGLEVKARILRMESQSMTLSHALATQKEQMNLLLGRDVRTEFRVAALAEPAAYENDVRTAQSAAIRKRPELREARLKQQQAEYDRRVKRAEYIPEVNAMFGYLSPFGISMLPSNIAVAGVSMTWEPFDWGRKKHELAEKEGTLKQAALGIQQAESAVLVEVAAAFRKLEEARMQVKVALMSQELAKEQFRVVKTRYEEKSALLRDVLQQQAAVTDANGQYTQALLSFWTAKADFEKAIGQDF